MYRKVAGSLQAQLSGSLKFIHQFSHACGLKFPLAAWDLRQKKLFSEVRDVAQEYFPIKCIPSGVSHSLTKSSLLLMEHRSSTSARYRTLIWGVYDSVHAECDLCEVDGSLPIQLKTFLECSEKSIPAQSILTTPPPPPTTTSFFPFEVNPRQLLQLTFFYYTASSMSGQDEPNRALWLATRADKMSQIAHCDWLPEQARWGCLARSGLPAVSGGKNFPESQIIDGWMDDLYLNTIKIKAISLWVRV